MAGGGLQAAARVMAGPAARAVAQGLGEGLAGVLERLRAGVRAGLGAAADVEALLGPEVHVHALRDGIGDHGLQRGDGGLLDRLDDRLDQGLARFLEDAAHDQTGGLGGARGADFGQAEGEGGGRLSCDDLCRKDRQLGDHRDFHPDDDPGAGVQREGDELGGRTCIVEVAGAVAGELLPGPAEAVDAVTGVGRQHVAGRRDALGLQLLDGVRELPPSVGGLVHLVLVARRPVVAEHFEDPLQPVRQHERHGFHPP